MIPDSTSQAVIAQMRLQFWRDAVKSIYQVRLSFYAPYHIKSDTGIGRTSEAPYCNGLKVGGIICASLSPTQNN
jgi:hypothetical protein